jgi:sortase A
LEKERIMLASRRRRRKFASYLLIGAGMVLLFLGGRDVFEARMGQREAQRVFDQADVDRPSPFKENRQIETRVPLGEAFAKLIIPRLHTQLYVVEGDGASQLRRGPGHVAGTVMPGHDGNCVIAGHRDTHFRVLKDIRKGDEIVLQTRAGEYTYLVKGTQVVSPTNTASLKPTHDAELHLITCYPFYYLGSAPKRFVVQAQLLDTSASANAAASDILRSAY